MNDIGSARDDAPQEPPAKWQRSVLDVLDLLGDPMPRSELLAAAVACEPKPVDGRRDVRKQSVDRALESLLASGTCVDHGIAGIARAD